MRDEISVVYLGGLGRSGSTLAQRLLGQLPGVCAAGEVVHLWRRGVAEGERCGCGAGFSECAFWSQVGRVAFGGWDRISVDRITELANLVDRTRFIPALAWSARWRRTRQDLADYTSYYLRVYQAIAQVSGCRTVVDSSKHASLAFCLSSRAEIDLRVIHVVRDSRGVAYSWSTRVARPEARGQDYMTTYSPARAAAHWNAQNGALELLGLSTLVLRVRYEDLALAPGPTVRLMARFAGLPADDGDLAFLGGDGDRQWAELDVAHTASGNPIRFATGKIVIRADERWRTAMPAAQRHAVTAMTLPLLKRYGYGW